MPARPNVNLPDETAGIDAIARTLIGTFDRVDNRADAAAGAVVVLDATLGLEDQDKKIINLVEEQRKGILFASSCLLQVLPCCSSISMSRLV